MNNGITIEETTKILNLSICQINQLLEAHILAKNEYGYITQSSINYFRGYENIFKT